MRWKKETLKIRGIQAACIAAGVFLYLLLDGMAEEGAGVLKRNLPGEGEAVYDIQVEGLEAEKINLQIPVKEREFTEEEVSRVFAQVKAWLETEILGENPGKDQVYGDLNLVSSHPETGVLIHWETEPSDVIDRYGTLYEEAVPGEGILVDLAAELTIGEYEDIFHTQIQVIPPPQKVLTEATEKFLEQVEKENTGQQQTDYLVLPDNYQGKALSYHEQDEELYGLLPVLGLILALCYPASIQSSQKKKEKEREQRLLLDYSEMVSKLMVFVGAGMTISRAWERIVKDYEAGSVKEQPVYEEMCRTYYDMKGGMSEGRAYGEFGRRCRLPPYRKLAALLEQSRKEGTKQLRTLLNLEMMDAFEQRKNLARKMGEEAETKLLIPLFLMLGIVLIMVMVPAFLSFY
ncbi:MAG: hypothetical protein ACLTKI_05465 [Lachnospiraceae bacterium]